jgi:hypothetical protein
VENCSSNPGRLAAQFPRDLNIFQQTFCIIIPVCRHTFPTTVDVKPDTRHTGADQPDLLSKHTNPNKKVLLVCQLGFSCHYIQIQTKCLQVESGFIDAT